MRRLWLITYIDITAYNQRQSICLDNLRQLSTHKPRRVKSGFFMRVTFNKGNKEVKMVGFKKTVTVILLVGMGFTGTSHASLTSSGTLTVYDSLQDITWTKDANLSGITSWDTAVAWANNLDYAGYTDWVLPTIDQLITQFSTNLGEARDSSIADSHNANYNLFTNVQSYHYWSGSEYAPYPDSPAWLFDTRNGVAGLNFKGAQYYAWAVRPGDVSAVPVPGAIWLFGSALLGFLGLRRNPKS
jgi:hypothetical protein